MRHGKQLENMIKKKGKFFFFSKKRMIFEAWRDTIQNESAAYQKLVVLIKRANQRVAFGMIRGAAFDEKQNLNHNLRMNRVWMKFAKGNLQAAFSKWRSQSMKTIMVEFSNV